MSETTPRELIPESLMTPELPAESEAVSAVRQEKEALEQGAKAAMDAIRNLDPSASDDEVTEAMEARKAAQERLSNFQDMWADYGGQAIDDAQEAVAKASGDTASTTYHRAIARLTAAEDAFHGRLQSERDAIYEDAYKENDAFNAEVDAAIAASPALTEMNDLALKISHLRHDAPNPRTAPRDALRLVEYQEKLEELQEAFLRSDEFDTRYANEIANRSLRPVAETVSDDSAEKKSDTLPTDEDLDDTEGKKPDVDPTDEELEGDDDADKKDDVEPTDDELEGDDADKKDDVEPTDDELEDDEDGTKKPDVLPTDDELESDDDVDKKDDVEPTDDELEGDDAEPEAEKKKWYNPKTWGARLYRAFTYETDDGERKLSGKRLTIATLGLAAVAAAAYFTFRTGSDHSQFVPKGGPKGGDAIDAGSVPPVHPEAVVPGADLPPSVGFEHPWNWAKEAFGAEHAMSTLKDLAAKAAEHGHDVQWSGSGTHESVTVDGNDNTKFVIDTFKQFYTK